MCVELMQVLLLVSLVVSTNAALDMGARLLPNGGCSFKVWAPHGEAVRVEVKKPGKDIVHDTIELQKVCDSACFFLDVTNDQ